MGLLGILLIAVLAGPGDVPKLTADVGYLDDHRTERLDVWTPGIDQESPFPAIVLIHGGGWVGGSKSGSTTREVAKGLAGEGYVVFSVDYTLSRTDDRSVREQVVSPGWPGNLFDCKAAVQFVRATADRWHVDPDRIAVAGFSAGAQLALMVGLTADNPRFDGPGPHSEQSSAVRCIVDLYGITDVSIFGRSHFLEPGLDTAGEEAATILRAASPLTHVSADSPPVFIAHGSKDSMVDPMHSERLAALLEQNDVPHELHLVWAYDHGFGLFPVRPEALAFLETHLAPRGPSPSAGGDEPERATPEG